MGGDAPNRYERSVPAEPEQLEHLHDLIDETRRGWPEVASGDFDMVETAVIELAGNVVRHGRTSGVVEITLIVQVDPDAIRATLVDAGEKLEIDLRDGQMPEEMSESGRGIAMARVVVDELKFEHAGGLNTWEMVRFRR